MQTNKLRLAIQYTTIDYQKKNKKNTKICNITSKTSNVTRRQKIMKSKTNTSIILFLFNESNKDNALLNMNIKQYTMSIIQTNQRTCPIDLGLARNIEKSLFASTLLNNRISDAINTNTQKTNGMNTLLNLFLKNSPIE